MNRIYKTIRNRGSNQTVVASEFAKGNKKSLPGKILALSVAGILAGAYISAAQAATVTSSSNDINGLGSLPNVLSNLSDNTVNFGSNINPTDISGIKITQTGVTIQGNGTLDTGSTVNDISDLIDTNRDQAEDYLAFNDWLENDLQTEINNAINSNNVDSSTLTKITVDGQAITTDDGKNALFYSQDGQGNGLSAKNLYFTSNNAIINLSKGTWGGSLLGAYSTTSDSTIGNLDSNVFSQINLVSGGEAIHGGGLVGAYSKTNASVTSIGNIHNNVFSDNTIQSNRNRGIYGGGLIGIQASSGTSSIGNISSNIFDNNSIKSTTGLYGGGLIGTYYTTSSQTSFMGSINNNIFSNNSLVTAAGDYYIRGGGLIGIYAPKVSIDDISSNMFTGNNITTTGIYYGGGLIGSSASSSSLIGSLNNNVFSGNTITATTKNIQGGILRQYLSSTLSASWGNFSGNIFTGNTISAEGSNSDIYSGVLYSSGLKDGLVISDSIFNNNKISATGTVYATAVGINTKNKTTHIGGHELTLSASEGGVTYIANHEDNNGDAAIYMGAYGENALSDATLSINPKSNGLVVLEAPINIDQNNDKAFTMNIDGDGDFYWGGKNTIIAAGGSSVNFNSGRTTLLSGYSLTDSSINGAVNFNSGSTTLVQLTEDPDNLAPTITTDKVNVNSGSKFGVNNTFSYSDDILINNLDKTILTLNAASGDAINANSSTLESGTISTGAYDYDYTLTWQGSGTDKAELKFDYIESSKSYNKNLAGSALTMAPGIMAYNLPAMQDTNHYMSNVLRANRTSFASVEREDTNWNLWMTPSYTYTKRSGSGDRIGYDVNTYGTTMGFDVNPLENNNAVVGIALSIYQQDFDATDTDVDGTTYLGQIYAGVTLPKDIDVLGNIGYGKVNYDQKRTAKDERLSADYSSNIFFVGTQISKLFALSESVQLRPFFGYDYLNVTVDSFDEKGNTYNLHSSSYDHDFHRTRLGTALNWNSDMGINFGAEAYYQNLAGDRQAKTGVYFINDANKEQYISVGDAMERHSFGLGLSAATSLTDNLSLEGNYNLNLASHTQAHQAKFTLSYAF